MIKTKKSKLLSVYLFISIYLSIDLLYMHISMYVYMQDNLLAFDEFLFFLCSSRSRTIYNQFEMFIAVWDIHIAYAMFQYLKSVANITINLLLTMQLIREYLIAFNYFLMKETHFITNINKSPFLLPLFQSYHFITCCNSNILN